MTEPTLITAAEISRLAGVNRATVSNWRRRHADFPSPEGGTDASPAYDRAKVEAWLSLRDALPELPPEERLWRAVAEAGKADSGGLGEAVLKTASGIAGGTVSTYGMERGLALGSLLDRYADAEGIPITPFRVARLMAALADPEGRVVLDLACGTGELLAAAARQDAAAVFGQEINRHLAKLADIRLGLEVRTSANLQQASVVTGDSFYDDEFEDIATDVVLCHPPFGDMDWGHDELAHDPRWLYGIPPKSEPELAWAQAALARLRPGGLAVMLMPPALASRPTGRRIRGEMVRRGVIRAIIGLPAGAVRPQNVAAHLWIMERPSGRASGDPRVLFADAAQFSADISDQADTSDQDEGWVQLTERVLNAWLGFQRGASDSNDSQRDVAGYGTVVRAIDLLDDDVDLSPARHDVPRRDQKDPAETTVLLKSLRRALGEILHETAEDLPEAAWPAAGNHGAGSRSTGTRVDRARVDSGTGPETGWRMVTVADLERTRTVAIQRATTKTGTTRMEEGDVIIPALGANAPVRGHVVTREEAGTEVPPNTHLVRPNHGHIDPWFLAGFLVAPASVRAAAYGTNGGRIEVRRLTVPFLPLPEQQAYGAAFRRLENSEARTREIARVTAELTELVRTGLRDRTILPG